MVQVEKAKNNRQKGASLVEYVLLIALIAATCAMAVSQYGIRLACNYDFSNLMTDDWWRTEWARHGYDRDDWTPLCIYEMNFCMGQGKIAHFYGGTTSSHYGCPGG